MNLHLVATCALGLEELVADELRTLGIRGPVPGRGAVTFRGTWTDVWRCNWRLRTANRVLMSLGQWPAADGDALARGAEKLVAGDRRWAGASAEELFGPHHTLSIRATSRRSRITDVRWATLKLKDGLVDGQRRRFGQRASIERKTPDRAYRLLLDRDRATLLLDTSGEPLDRRGYRMRGADAPVREQLAAACVLAAEWEGEGPVFDPMCGSGTLLIEAAWIAQGVAPGHLRQSWAFERLPAFDRAAFDAIREEPIPALAPDSHFYGVDRDPAAVAATRVNARHAGLDDQLTVARDDAFKLAAPAPNGLLLVNPAYGERLTQVEDQWRRLGDLLKQGFQGWRAVVLAGGEGKGKGIGLRTRKRVPVKNGPLDARIMVFDLF